MGAARETVRRFEQAGQTVEKISGPTGNIGERAGKGDLQTSIFAIENGTFLKWDITEERNWSATH